LYEIPLDDAQCVKRRVDSHKWEAHGVSLDRAPCSMVDANDTTPRANPDHGSKVCKSN